MKRNELIKAVGKRIDAAKLEAARADTPAAWAKLGELERFCNDLCAAPSKHNRERKYICYTMKEAARRFREIE